MVREIWDPTHLLCGGGCHAQHGMPGDVHLTFHKNKLPPPPVFMGENPCQLEVSQ